MFELNNKNFPKEVLIGCFTDLPEMNLAAARIHQVFVGKESQFVKTQILPSPLIVIVDPFSDTGVFNLKVNSQRHKIKFRPIFLRLCTSARTLSELSNK